MSLFENSEVQKTLNIQSQEKLAPEGVSKLISCIEDRATLRTLLNRLISHGKPERSWLSNSGRLAANLVDRYLSLTNGSLPAEMEEAAALLNDAAEYYSESMALKWRKSLSTKQVYEFLEDLEPENLSLATLR